MKAVVHLSSINRTGGGRRWCTSAINRQGGSGALELCKAGGRELFSGALYVYMRQ